MGYLHCGICEMGLFLILYLLNLFLGNMKTYLHFLSFATYMWLNPFLTEEKDLRILHSKYHGCWCPGDLPGQGIYSHGIDLVLIEYTGLSTGRIRADSRFAPSQWETALLCNDGSHWLGPSQESALWINNGDTETETGMCELRASI